MMKTPTKARAFTEYTYTDGESEVMVHHRNSDNKVIALYTYAKDAPSFDDCENLRGKPMTPFPWKTGPNPAFLHLSGASMRRFVAEFIDSGELVCPEREETE
jgi:hypothetical protein